MRTADFDFEFPEGLIAYQPLPRGESRMMVVDRDPGPEKSDAKGATAPSAFSHTRDLIEYLQPGDALVLNDCRRDRRKPGAAIRNRPAGRPWSSPANGSASGTGRFFRRG
jgi:S-adenosylmethionine:tRNA-ribosyltransferase-isomerase (queuine synthetase)